MVCRRRSRGPINQRNIDTSRARFTVWSRRNSSLRETGCAQSQASGKWIHILPNLSSSACRNIALGLSELGVRPETRALLSETRPEWSIVDIHPQSARQRSDLQHTGVEQVRLHPGGFRRAFNFVSGAKSCKLREAGIENVKSLEGMVFFDADGLSSSEGRDYAGRPRRSRVQREREDRTPSMLS